MLRPIRAGLPVVAVAALAVVGVSAGSAHTLARDAKLAPALRVHSVRPAVARHGVLRAPRSAFLHVRRGRTLARLSGSSTPVTSCGVTLSTPGTYTLSNNIDGSGDTYCVEITVGGVKLNLNGHSITDTAGTATEGVLVEGTGTSIRNDSVYGGKISNYAVGVYLDGTTRSSLSNLRIAMGSVGNYGVDAYYAADSLSKGLHINAGTYTAPVGWFGEYGSGNTLTGSFLSYPSGVSYASGGYPNLVKAEYEYEDTFSNDTAACKAGPSVTYDCGGTGYYDLYSNRNTYSGDKSYGNAYGFYLYEYYDGTVTATDNTATDYNAGTAYGNDGFYNYVNYDDNNYLYKRSTYSGNTVEGFADGFYDYDGIRSVYSSNTVNYASTYGYYLDYPIGYSITGNTSTGTNTSTSPTNSLADGFYLTDDQSYNSVVAFNNNTSNDNYYGFYSTDQAVHGTGNTATGDEYDAYRVEIGG